MTGLIDDDARDRIDADIATTLFVEAGAGVGKTHHLVKRILALIAADVPVSRIAAITFTEKAAGELRDRVRSALQVATVLTPAQRDAALDDLDAAPIGTIHSFAARVLEQNPIEAGLPPGIEVVDELRAGIAFAQRWRRARAALFGDRDAATAIELLLAAGATLGNLEDLARELDAAWDRVRDAPAPLLGPVTLDVGPLVRLLQRILDLRGECTDPDDTMVRGFPLLEEGLDALRTAAESGDVTAQLTALATLKRPRPNAGRTTNWRDIGEVRELVGTINTLKAETLSLAIDPALTRVIATLGGVLEAEAHERRRRGTLEFHDLLILARDLLVGPGAATAHARLHDAYPHLLLDEFQDTDPLQAELAVRIAADTVLPADGWVESVTPAGRLFMVGDPKQSIYRFRRADIATYIEQGERVRSAPGGAAVSMVTNFRSTAPVLEWINTAFGTLIVADGHRQPGYTPLSPAPDRAAWDAREGGPAVVVLPATDAGNAAQIKADEAAAIASAVLRAVGRHPGAPGAAWLVEKKNRETTTYERRQARLEDVCILLPSRTALPALEAALEAAGIDFVAESSSLVYSTREVADLLLAVRAIANLADEAALVLALRSPLYACGDDDLLRWRAAGGRWMIGAEVPAGQEENPVAAALGSLDLLLRYARTLTAGAVIERLVRERLVRPVVLDTPRSRDVWRRIRFVVDQAHAWSDATHGSLREYVEWAELQQDEKARVAERSVPEEDLDAVRITTIHQSKGREFPIVALHGMGAGWSSNRPTLLWTDDGRPLAAFSAEKQLESAGYGDAYENEKQFLLAERLRLLYVACTRAESHLIVSGFRAKRAPSWGHLLAPALSAAAGVTLDLAPVPEVRSRTSGGEAAPVVDWDTWLDERARWEGASARSSTISVTGMAHGGAEPFIPTLTFTDAEGDALFVERRFDGEGGSGADLGTAVHRVMELSELDAEADVDALARLVTSASGLDALGVDAGTVAAMARSALTAEPVARAAMLPHWLELPVSAVRDLPETGPIIVEGVADLVYREDDGSLVIVDFKTDQGITETSVEAYWTQLNAYADLIAEASGQSVSALHLVFCRDDPAHVRSKVRG
ncbi:UvrD-helicase domain-containing protein [Microcella sp.]|uniref:UvrD-helicase domain-containing protein n=1 Tax=Microcella sp. TaxID=1913979 RepID=UPI003F6FD2C2